MEERKELNPSELRIGNWINDHKGIPRRVSYLTEDTIGLDIGGGAIKYQCNPIVSLNIKDLSLIPPTEDLLLRCGFNKVENSEWTFSVPIMALKLNARFNGKHCYFEFGGIYFGDTFKYLHQLQNFVSTVTGGNKELEIEL